LLGFFLRRRRRGFNFLESFTVWDTPTDIHLAIPNLVALRRAWQASSSRMFSSRDGFSSRGVWFVMSCGNCFVVIYCLFPLGSLPRAASASEAPHRNPRRPTSICFLRLLPLAVVGHASAVKGRG
jgi:hypothetical protein